jgi:hypothetical protein
MFGPSFTAIFRNRWMALIWAGLVIWTAIDIAGPGDSDPAANNQSVENLTDVSGSPITKEDIETLRRFAEGH